MGELRRLQTAFHAVATSSAPLDDALALVRDDGVDPRDRMQVYAHAYRVRIYDALVDEMPKLHHSLGDAAFVALVGAYLRTQPTRSPTLRDAGLALPAFLSAREPARPWLADMARLERARTEVFDAGDAVPLDRADLEGLPPEAFAELRLSLVPASAFVDLAWNADEVWDAIEDARPCPGPRPADATVLVWRRGLQIIHRTLELDEAVLLTRLAAGETFGSACDALVRHEEPTLRAIELLLRWLDAAILVAWQPDGNGP